MFTRVLHPLHVILVAEVAQISVDFIADNNLHKLAPSRTVSPATAQLLTGGYIVPLAALFLVLCMAAGNSPLLRDIVLPAAAVAIGVAKSWLTSGMYGVQLFLELFVLFLVLTAIVTAVLNARRILFRLATMFVIILVVTALIGSMLVPA